MARVTNQVLVLLAVVLAVVVAFEHVDMSHDFLEVDPLRNEYAQLAEHGIAFTELGAEVEFGVDAEAELEAEAEVEAEAEAEVEAEADAEFELDAEAEAEAETELDAEAEVEAPPAAAPAAAPIPGVPITEIPTPPAILALPQNSYRLVSAQQAADIKKAEELANKNAAAARIAISKSLPVINPTGWTFRERGAPESVNVTDVYALAYDRLKSKLWSTVNITTHYPIREFTYVLLPGSGKTSDMKNVQTALHNWFGVPKTNIITPIVDYSKGASNTKALFNLVNNTYWNVAKEQKVIYITNSNGVVSLHNVLTQFPEAATQTHGIIALNPTWGGSHLATDAASLVKAQTEILAKKFGLDAGALKDFTYAARQNAVRASPVDYNGLRVLAVATHNEREKDADVKSLVKYVFGRAKEINDGVVALSDQIIPGGRAIILDGLSHGTLASASKATDAVDTLLAAQSIIYTFFKVTP